MTAPLQLWQRPQPLQPVREHGASIEPGHRTRQRNRLRMRAPRNEKHDLTHQLEKRLIHINAVLGRRLKERRPKALGKGSPLHVRHLAVIKEIALRGKRQKAQALSICPRRTDQCTKISSNTRRGQLKARMSKRRVPCCQQAQWARWRHPSHAESRL
jgi:hypothetical protein